MTNVLWTQYFHVFVVFAWLMMVEVVRNNFEDLFPEIKNAIEESAFVGR